MSELPLRFATEEDVKALMPGLEWYGEKIGAVVAEYVRIYGELPPVDVTAEIICERLARDPWLQELMEHEVSWESATKVARHIQLEETEGGV